MRHAGSGPEHLLAVASLALVSASAMGCEVVNQIGPETCSRPEFDEPLLWAEGSVENGVYSTSPWDGEWIDFYGGAQYRLPHSLGQAPPIVVSYLSFNARGTFEDGAAGQAAGNQVLYPEVDGTNLVVFNDSCAAYYLRVVATLGDLGASGGDSGGADAGGGADNGAGGNDAGAGGAGGNGAGAGGSGG